MRRPPPPPRRYPPDEGQIALNRGNRLTRGLLFYWPLVPSASVFGPSVFTGSKLYQLVPAQFNGLGANAPAAHNGALMYVHSGTPNSAIPIRHDAKMGRSIYVDTDADDFENSNADHQAINVGTAWSFSIWAKPISRAAATPNTQSILMHGLDNLSLVNVGADFNISGGNLQARCYSTVSSGNYKGANGATVIRDGEWWHIAGTWDSSNIKLYVNGVNDATTSTGGGTPSTVTNPWKLGRSGMGYGKIQFQNFAVWSGRTLTPAEVRNLYVEPWQMILPTAGFLPA